MSKAMFQNHGLRDHGLRVAFRGCIRGVATLVVATAFVPATPPAIQASLFGDTELAAFLDSPDHTSEPQQPDEPGAPGDTWPDAGGCDDAGTSCCGDIGDGHAGRRFYIAGIIGASFATLQSGGTNTAGDFPNTGRASANLLTAGGALGTAIDREAGLLRLEVEGRGRDLLTGQTNSFEPPTPTFFYSVRAADGWSVMANAWREWYLNDRLGFYGGGGIGAGGYRLTVDDGVVSGYGHVGGFAWQAGTGTTLRLTQRTTLDLGYRFFDTVSDGLPLTISGAPVSGGNYQSNFYASELLLSVRIYEPFRDRPGR